VAAVGILHVRWEEGTEKKKEEKEEEEKKKRKKQTPIYRIKIK